MEYGLLLTALDFAARKHRDQRRKDAQASPYINHPIALAQLLSNDGQVADPEVLMAALLHDTVEDTDCSEQDLLALFGPRVTAMVLEVSDDKRLPKAERKRLQIEHAPHLSYGAKLVKLADKICNLRDLDQAPPADWPLERICAYYDWAYAVVAGLRGTHPQLEQLFDLAWQRRPREA